jgi:type I restriction enzyme S subunit
MGDRWRKSPLEKAMDAIIDYRGKTPKKTESGIPLITAKIVKNGRINPTQEYISESDYDAWMKRGIPQEGDIVITTEAPLGEVAQLNGDKVALAQRIITLRGKSGLLESNYLKYLLQSHEVQYQLDGRASGTTVSGIKQSELRQIILKFPSLSKQKVIAHILGSLDNKIELNRQMNATLEGMAQALFKSWFVDFDPVIDNALAAGNPIPEAFAARAETRRKALAHGTANRDVAKQFPAAFQFTEEMGWIPEGWEISQLHTLIDLIGGGTPKTSVDEYWNASIPWFSVVDAPNNSDVFVIDTDKKITEMGLEQSSTKILREGSTIISARGTVGKCALVGLEK